MKLVRDLFAHDPETGVLGWKESVGSKKQSEKHKTRVAGLRSNNKSGVNGVSWDNRAKKWKPSFKINGKTQNLGHFTEISDAEKALKKARKTLKV